MIFLKNTTPYLPREQMDRGGPLTLQLMDLLAASDFVLPDQSRVSLPVWDIDDSHLTEGRGVVVMWKVADGFGAVDAGAVYNNFNSNYRNSDWIESRSPIFWDRYSSGRWSVQNYPEYANALTWGMVPVTAPQGVYNARSFGGHTGMIYVPSWDGSPLHLAGSFGSGGSWLEWMVCAEVVGSPIYPTRPLTGLNDGVMKKITKTTSGIAYASRVSDNPVLDGTLSFVNDPDVTIAATLNACENEDDVILMPTGLDMFDENNPIRWNRPDAAIPVIMYDYTGPGAYGGGLRSGRAFDASIKFIQTRRAA